VKNIAKPKINWPHITIIIFIASLIIGGFLGYQLWILKKVGEDQVAHSVCLSNNEIVDFDYNIDLYNTRSVKIPDKLTTTIYIKNKDTGQEIYRFVINDVRTNADTLEIHQCGVYVIRNFDFDEKKGFYKKHELWHYTYEGKGAILMNNEELQPYGLYVRIDPLETYFASDQFYLGHPDHAIVVKNIKSPLLEKILIVRPLDIWQRSPQLTKERRVGVMGWSKDGKYLWGGSESQTDYAYFRVNINNKNELDVFVMPEDAVHYGPPRVDTGYIWYICGPPWVGIYEMTQQIYEEWRKEGRKVSLFLYNLFTKEKIILVTIDDPEWDFKPKWLSDSELQYELPTGEKKIYTISK